MLSQQDIQQFDNDGAILLKGIFDKSWIEKVELGILKNFTKPSKYSEKLKGPTGCGFYFNDYCNWTTIPEFTEYVQKSPAAEIAGKLMNSEVTAFLFTY